MMNRKNLTALVSVALLACSTLGCNKNKPAEGPMEEAGEDMDEAAEDTGEAMEEGAEDTEEALDEATEDMDDNQENP